MRTQLVLSLDATDREKLERVGMQRGETVQQFVQESVNYNLRQLGVPAISFRSRGRPRTPTVAAGDPVDFGT